MSDYLGQNGHTGFAMALARHNACTKNERSEKREETASSQEDQSETL